MVRLVLFDFDGTIADSSEGIFYTALQTMKRLGMESQPPIEKLRLFIGPPIKESFRLAFDLEEEDVLEEAVRIYREIYRDKGDKMLYPYSGIKETIEGLKVLGVKVGVATNKADIVVMRCLENIRMERDFDFVSGPREYEHANKGRLITRAREALDIPPSETLMVGDTENDRIGADEAHCLFLPALWGFGYRAKDEVMFPLSLKRPLDILDYVRKENKRDD